MTNTTDKDSKPVTKGAKLAVILIRGLVGVRQEVKDTLRMLGLTRKNHCVVVNSTPSTLGMIKKAKDFITWGEISNEMFTKLLAERGEEFKGRTTDSKKKYSYNFLEIDSKKYKSYFRLNPPRKGFGRKGIKMPFKIGGALGNRSEKINDLLERMI
jgi:large subunit ribosomal protein L30